MTGTTKPVRLSGTVEYERRDGLAVVTLSCPDSRNALSPALLAGLQEALDLATTEQVGGLILTGAGRSFCAGGDLSGVHDALQGDIDETLGAIVDQLHDVISGLRALPMPTVAAVNGSAIGAGVALALAADVRVISRSTSFVTGYVAVGASPDGGASFHLARSLGAPQALASLITNRRLTAEHLETAGLADAVVEDGAVVEVAVELGVKLSLLSFPAIQAMRDLVYGASSRSLSDHLEAEKQHFLAIAHTQAFRDAVAPFARRAPASVQA